MIPRHQVDYGEKDVDSPRLGAPFAFSRRGRDAQADLIAAKRELAPFGFGGARIDAIAERAKANKRMIYHYLDSKETLFTAVLEDAYLDIVAGA